MPHGMGRGSAQLEESASKLFPHAPNRPSGLRLDGKESAVREDAPMSGSPAEAALRLDD